MYREREREKERVIGKEKCYQCNLLENLLHEKGMQYNPTDLSKLSHGLLTYLKNYCSSYLIVLSANIFSTFHDTLEHFARI